MQKKSDCRICLTPFIKFNLKYTTEVIVKFKKWSVSRKHKKITLIWVPDEFLDKITKTQWKKINDKLDY